MDEKTRFLDILRKHHLSVTKSRLEIFSCFSNHRSHSLSQLAHRVQCDRSTVYRVVELFESIGVLQKSFSGWKYRYELTDIFVHHHHHLTCLNCGKVINIHAHALESAIQKIASENNFVSQTHRIDIEGYCQSCTK